MQMQANTSSLPDLSNLSIPSPIQNPIDVEHESAGKSSQQERTNPFQVPYRVVPRRNIGKQLYPRQIASNPDVLESLQRDQKLQLNLYNNLNMDKSNDINIVGINSGPANSGAAPLSPVTSPPYYWAAPMSPLATGDLMQPVQSDLQQQLPQFQIQTDNNPSSNGIGNPPPYPYMNDNGSYNNYFSDSSYPSKQNVYRINSGPAQYSKQMCDNQLNSALMKMKSQNGNELSEADLNSVRVALAPLDFDDVQILSGDNTELVDQGAEEQFRLERATYQQ